MFATAISVAQGYTRPLIVSWVDQNDVCTSSLGTHVLVNADGWALTAWHMVAQVQQLEAALTATIAYEKEKAAILADPSRLPDQRRKKARQLSAPVVQVKAFSLWCGNDAWTFKEFHAVPGADLAAVRINGIDPASVSQFPTFKDPSSGIVPGTSLCRLGFPFQEVTPKFDAANNRFDLGTVQLVFFPNEGILTRIASDNPNAADLVAFIETSSPGLKGQSGGPIFDRQGTVWGIQSHTGHLALGFSPPQPGGKPGQVEHQFLNVGRGAHPATIVNLLRKVGAAHALSSY